MKVIGVVRFFVLSIVLSASSAVAERTLLFPRVGSTGISPALESQIPVRINRAAALSSRSFRVPLDSKWVTIRLTEPRKWQEIGTNNRRILVGTGVSGSITDEKGVYEFSLAVSSARKKRADLHAIIRSGSDRFSVKRIRGGRLVIHKISEREHFVCGGAVSKSAPSVASFAGNQTRMTFANSAHRIDLGVLYTAEAGAAAGGEEAAALEAAAEVTQTNQDYVNSGVNQEVRLRFVSISSSSEAGLQFSQLLDAFELDSDRLFNSIHKLRETYGTDISSLFTNNGEYCGIAELLKSSTDISFFSLAFNVISRSTGCLNDHTLAHEMGHNMGAQHDISNAETSGAFDYSYGFRFTGQDSNLYHTIMAYQVDNTDSQIPYFSGPGNSYQGVVIGSADSADNVSTLNNIAALVSGFREPEKFTKLKGSRKSDGTCTISSKIINSETTELISGLSVRIFAIQNNRARKIGTRRTNSKGVLSHKVSSAYSGKQLFLATTHNTLSKAFRCK